MGDEIIETVLAITMLATLLALFLLPTLMRLKYPYLPRRDTKQTPPPLHRCAQCGFLCEIIDLYCRRCGAQQPD